MPSLIKNSAIDTVLKRLERRHETLATDAASMLRRVTEERDRLARKRNNSADSEREIERLMDKVARLLEENRRLKGTE